MKTILDAIGNTPLINIEGIWVKMEYLNPSGSIKARIAKYIVEKAEKDGLLKPGDTIVEASSGNTGNAMSMVAAVKGYKMLVLMPDGMSPERTAISQAFGAEVKKMGDFHVNAALAEAKRLGDLPGYFSSDETQYSTLSPVAYTFLLALLHPMDLRASSHHMAFCNPVQFLVVLPPFPFHAVSCCVICNMQ